MEDGKQFCLQFLLCEGKVQRNLNEEQLVVGCHQDSPSAQEGTINHGENLSPRGFLRSHESPRRTFGSISNPMLTLDFVGHNIPQLPT